MHAGPSFNTRQAKRFIKEPFKQRRVELLCVTEATVHFWDHDWCSHCPCKCLRKDWMWHPVHIVVFYHRLDSVISEAFFKLIDSEYLNLCVWIFGICIAFSIRRSEIYLGKLDMMHPEEKQNNWGNEENQPLAEGFSMSDNVTLWEQQRLLQDWPTVTTFSCRNNLTQQKD